MKEHNSSRNLFCLLILLSASVLGSRQASHSNDIISRAGRVLQGAQPYVIVKNPDVKKFCDDSGIKESEISINLADRAKLRAKIEGRYQSLYDSLKPFISNTNSDPNPAIKEAFGKTPLGLCIIIAVLSFLSLIFMFVWSLFECCCQKACCVKETKKGEDRSCMKVCCLWSAVVFAIATVIVCIIWAVFLGRIADRAPEVKCSTAILYSDIISGVQISNNETFAGVDGLTSILNQFDEVLTNVTNFKTNAANIKNKQSAPGDAGNINEKGTAAQTAYDTYKSSYNMDNYKYKGYCNTGATCFATVTASVIPSYAAAMPTIISEGMSTELNTIKSVGTSIVDAADAISKFDTATIDSTRSSFNDVKKSLNDQIKTPFTNTYNSIVKDKDYFGSFKSAARSFLISGVLVVVVLTVIFLIILATTAWLDKCHWMKCISKIIMLLQLTFGILILIFTVIAIILCIAIYLACYGINGSINEQNFLSVKLGVDVDAKVQDMVNECIYKDGKGDLMKAMGVNMGNMDNMNQMTNGVQQFKTLQSNLTNNPEPVFGKMVNDDQLNMISFTKEDRGVVQDFDYVSGYKAANANKCYKDIISPLVVGCPSPSDKSTSGDNSATNTNPPTGAFCISYAAKDIANYASRYGATGSGICTGVDNNVGSGVLTSSLGSADDFKAKITLMNTDYNVYYSKEKDLYNALKVNVNDMNIILSGMEAALNTLDTMKGSFSKVANCLVLQKEIILIENVMCFRLGNDLFAQIGCATALGVLLFLYSWCMCCSVRIADKKKEDSANDPNKYADNATYNQSPQNFNQSPVPLDNMPPPLPVQTGAPKIEYT